jgi:hypothetical protein
VTALTSIREGIATVLTTAITNAQCSGYLLSNPTPPCFEVEPAAITYDAAFNRGADVWTLTVRGIVAAAVDVASQKTLDTWIASGGAGSVKAALEADQTLGGVAAAVHVTELGNYGARVFASQPGNTYLGCEWTVSVWAVG